MIKFGQRFLILEGGIAVGKTLFAKEVAKKLVSNNKSSNIPNNIHFFQLHEGYSYSNFVYGQQVETQEGKILYKKGEQPLLEIIENCNQSSGANEYHVVILDDMNRCNISAVLGDLFSAFGSNEIGNVIKTDEADIRLPDNLFFIATMNPIAGKESVDYAWLRRFNVIELRADSEYFISDELDNEIDKEEYNKYILYAKEIFEHVRMLFEYYFTDKENQTEMEKYIPGHGLFLQYDKNKKLKDNLLNLHNRLKYIVVPILQECVALGILSERVCIDIKALSDLYGNTIKIEQEKLNNQAPKLKDLYEALIVDSHTNAFFFFILHGSNLNFRVVLKNTTINIIEEEKYAEELNEKLKINRKGGLKPYAQVGYKIDDKSYRCISGTTMEKLAWAMNKDRHFYKKNKTCPIDELIGDKGLIKSKMNEIIEIFNLMKEE